MPQKKRSRWVQRYGYGTIYGRIRVPINSNLTNAMKPLFSRWLSTPTQVCHNNLHHYALSNEKSGGIDSCATAVIVSSMSRLLIDAIRNGNAQVISDVQRIAGAYEKEDWLPQSAEALTRNLFQYVYL